MTVDEARKLFAYGAWANGQVFDAAEELGAGDQEATIPSSFSSIRETLGHIAAAEWIWLQRWKGGSPEGPPDWLQGSSLSAVREALVAVENERADYLAGLGDDDLGRIVAYRTLAGATDQTPLEDQMRHVVNHSTYHRGQVATQLRQLGQTPPSTDLILYLRLGGPEKA